MKTQGELRVAHTGLDADAGNDFMTEDKEAEGDSTQAPTGLRRHERTVWLPRMSAPSAWG